MCTLQCFACLSSLPNEGTKRGAATTLNNFQIEIKDLMNINGNLSNINQDNNSVVTKREQVPEKLSVCSKCLSAVKLVVSSKQKVDRVETTVRKMQVDLLKQLNKLDKCLEGLWEEVEVIGGIIQNSDSECEPPTSASQLTDDVCTFRKDILDVKGKLQLFRNRIRNSTLTTASDLRDIPNKSLNFTEIPVQSSIKIKTEPEAIISNLNIDEDHADLNLLEYDDYFDISPSIETEDFTPPPPTLPESKPVNVNLPKSKWSRLPNKCTKCSKIFPLKSSLLRHLRIHHPNDRLQETVSCPHCQEYMPRQLLRTHKLHHCPYLKKSKPSNFPCTICKVAFQNVESLKDHNLKEHPDKLKRMCVICGKISASRQANLNHQITHEDPRNRKVEPCQDCGKIILTASVSSHRRFGCPKRENRSFLCQFCQEYFTTESSLKRHLRKRHQGQQMDKDAEWKVDLKKPTGHRRKIKVIAEEDIVDNLDEDKEDKPDDMEETEESDSDFIPSEGEIDENIKRKSSIKCPNCPKTFIWQEDLNKHKMSSHKNDWLSESTNCPYCMETMPRKLLRTHSQYHCPVNPKNIIYSCTLCKPSLNTDPEKFQQPTFPDLETLKTHVAAQHPKKMLSLICDICGLISASVHSHLKHQVRHVHPKHREFVECDDCGKSMLATSISSHKRFGCPKRERTKFPCIYCSKLFSTEMSVVRHVSRWHTDEKGEILVKPRRPKRLQCHLCGQWIQDKGQMRRHLKSRHQSREEREMAVCEFCGKEMLSVSLGQHEKYYCNGKERDAGAVKVVPCPICGKGFKSLSIMTRHKKVTHGNEKFGCEICGKIFSAKRNMEKHLERHKEIRRFECEFGCGRRFKQKQHLKRHTRLDYCRGEKGPRKERRPYFQNLGSKE